MINKENVKTYSYLMLGSFILAFGLYNIHSFAEITEGGILGLTLLLHYWFKISPSTSGFILNITCYLIGWKILGKDFIIKSIISAIGFSFFYFIFELFPPIYPEIKNHPFIASIIGAIFVGVGVGLAVKAGGAPGGDDALSISINAITGIKIQWIYLFNDLIILILSLSYIPLSKIIYSLITVTISGQLIGYINKDVSHETL